MTMNATQRNAGKRSGFSLVEVCLAMLIIGSGILLLFGLFPAGLKENEYSMGDTQMALFVDYAFSGMHANARKIVDWADWDPNPSQGQPQFPTLVLGSGSDNIGLVQTSDPIEVEYPMNSDNILKYKLSISPAEGTETVWGATLEVSSGTEGWMGTTFYTEFFYRGM